jgi:hypothetical protein
MITVGAGPAVVSAALASLASGQPAAVDVGQEPVVGEREDRVLVGQSE